MSDLTLAQIRPGDAVDGYYILKEATRKTTKAGKPYLYAVLTDVTGRMDTNVWDYDESVSATPKDAGSVVRVNGMAIDYNGAVQMKLFSLRRAGENEKVDLSRLVACAPLDRDAAVSEIRALVASMKDEDCRAVCVEMLRRHEKTFPLIPAAKNVHHGFVGGLLMHTVKMLRTAEFLSREYADVVDRDLLLAGTLLHDLAKDREYAVSGLGIVTDYTAERNLLGHLVMGAQEIADAARTCGVAEEKSLLLQHMILSHHGEPEYGAAVVPKIPEAEMLSYIDMLDSRMEILREALENIDPGAFTSRIGTLEGRQFYKHN